MQRGNSKKKEKRYCVVSFSDDEEDLFIVSSRWLTQGKSDYICLWPPYKGDARIKRAVMEEERPSSSWLTCSAKLIKKCKSYESAENFLNTVLLVSNRRSCILLHKEGDSIGSGSESPLKRIKIEADSDIFASNCAGSSSSDSNERPASPAVRESGTMVTVAEIVEESSTECSSPPPAVVTRSSNSSSTYEFLMENTSGQAQEEPSSAQDVVDNFNRSLEDKIDSLSKTLESVKKMVERNYILLQKLQAVPDNFCSTDIRNLPVHTLEELVCLNSKLADEVEFSTYVKQLGILGGKNHAEITRRVLSRVMSNEVAIQLNWIGGERKRSIQEYKKVIQLVLASVRQNKNYADATQVMVEDSMKKWLRNACDRGGGRWRRKKEEIEKKIMAEKEKRMMAEKKRRLR